MRTEASRCHQTVVWVQHELGAGTLGRINVSVCAITTRKVLSKIMMIPISFFWNSIDQLGGFWKARRKTLVRLVGRWA